MIPSHHTKKVVFNGKDDRNAMSTKTPLVAHCHQELMSMKNFNNNDNVELKDDIIQLPLVI